MPYLPDALCDIEFAIAAFCHATIQITADICGHLMPDAGGRLRSVMDQLPAGVSVVGADGEGRAGFRAE